MKKYLLTTVCIIMMSISASAVSLNKALLDHNGQVTIFDDLTQAVNASADGDVIYLTLGTFQVSTLNITKKITIRGTGATSIINGNVNISIAGTPTLDSPLLESLTVTGGVTVSSAMNNFSLKKCKMTGTLAINGAVNGGTIEMCQVGGMTFGGTIDNLYIDRCNVTDNLRLSSTINGMTVVNSILNAVSANSGATSNTTFVNCSFFTLYTKNFAATIVNSIISQSLKSGSTSIDNIDSSVLLNTLLNSSSVSIGTSSVTQGCYWGITSYSSTATLQEKGYLGTDGTIVGIYGGSTPFPETGLSFTPSAPKVTSSKLNLDAEKKELNVNLTVSPE